MSPRPLALGAVADDYTGASDLANTLTKAGLRTVQTIGVPDSDLALPEVDAVVVALKSRSIPAGSSARGPPSAGCADAAQRMFCSRFVPRSTRRMRAISARSSMRCGPMPAL